MIKFEANQLVDMLRLQNRLNSADIGPLWRDHHVEWFRGAWMKCAEIMNHIGWRESGMALPDLASIQMELIHIWSFCLSYALEATHAQLHTDDPYATADSIRNDMVLAENSLTYGFSAQVKLHGEMRALMNLVELLVAQCTNDQQVSPAITLELAEVVGLDTESMYRTFLGVRLRDLFETERKRLPDDGVLLNLLKANPGWDSEKVYIQLCLLHGIPAEVAGNQ